MRRVFIIILFSSFAAGSGNLLGQKATKQDTLQELMRRVDILTQELEKKKLGEVAERKYVGKFGMGPAASQVYYLAKTGASIAGYGEIVYENYADETDEGNSSGKRDQIDYLRHIVYTGFRFTDRLLFNAEIEFEHGKTASGSPGSVSLEFGYVEAAISPLVNIRAGMVLVPMGIINELHEPPTFMGSLRPQTERQIIPSTWRVNGFGVLGESERGLGYKFYLTEGLNGASFSASGIRGGRQNGAKAIAEDIAITGQVYYAGVPGLQLSGSFYLGNSGQGLTDLAGESIDATTRLYSIQGTYSHRGLMLRGLYARSSIDDVARLNQSLGFTGSQSIGEDQEGYYLTAGYDLMQLIKGHADLALLPFVQYEKLNTQKSVPAGFSANTANDLENLTIGLTFKPHPNIAFKADYLDRQNEAGTAVDQFNLAVTYLY